MLKKIIINADDFGISKGTNIAIIKGSKNGIINSTSIMINVLELNDESKDFLYNADIDLVKQRDIEYKVFKDLNDLKKEIIK